MRGWILGLALAACSRPQQTAQTAAAAAASAVTLEIDRQVDLVRVELRADLRARASSCSPGNGDCIERARVESQRALTPRLELARRAIAEQNRVADALDASARCADDVCRATQGALAAAAGAEVAALLVQLRQTAPKEAP